MTLRWTIRISTLLLLGSFIIYACSKKDTAPATTPLSFTVPEGFPSPVYDFSTNPLTEEGFQLGKKLFYDGKLSKDGNFPCASCHQQFAGFATFDHDLSHGFNNQFTTRNAPGIFNMAWQKELHWDGGVNNLEVQPLSPITAPNEMAEDIATVVKKLEADSTYPEMFRKAFGDRSINSQRILKAIAQFVGTIVSDDSKYDRVRKGTASFTDAEAMGYSIFKAKKCTSCHVEPLLTDNSYRNIGMALNPTINDLGRMRITGKSTDSLKFKVPSLRNVMLTFPYGHDGRFYSVKNVLDHYSDGVIKSATTDSLVANKIALTALDKFYLTQFFYTLTDSTLLKNKRFSEGF